MNKNLALYYRTLIIINFVISIAITWKVYLLNGNKFQELNINLVILLIYAILWFLALYKIYNYSKVGLKMYLSLVIVGFIFNILSNFNQYDKLLFLFSLSEHLVIGSILTFSYFSKIKSSFK